MDPLCDEACALFHKLGECAGRAACFHSLRRHPVLGPDMYRRRCVLSRLVERLRAACEGREVVDLVPAPGTPCACEKGEDDD